tara:strand:+ start:28207 stop:28908 length:702 start_codon:yes stop_codon:yes gene_type:complete
MNIQNILVIGAGHGIGLGLVQSLQSKYPGANIYASYRNQERASGLLALSVQTTQLDPLDEEQSESYFKSLPKLDLVYCAIGALEHPEKSLRDLNIDGLLQAFKVNAAIPALILKYAKAKFDRTSPSRLIFLSAMVGSIRDNELGGWYGYRAAKSALNMLVKTASIEYARSGLQTKLAVIHPGTTETELSRAYLGSVKHRVWSPLQSAEHIIEVSLDLDDSGVFKNWDGTTIAW